MQIIDDIVLESRHGHLSWLYVAVNSSAGCLATEFAGNTPGVVSAAYSHRNSLKGGHRDNGVLTFMMSKRRKLSLRLKIPPAGE